MQISTSFETDKNRKALIYTVSICALLLLMFILISWKVQPPTPAVVQDLMEINLGNNNEGFGEEQPLIKGERSPAEENVAPPQVPPPAPELPDKVVPDDNAEADAAAVNKPDKKVVTKTTTKDIAPVAKAIQKPAAKPKIVYNGPGTGNGNNATEDNGYKYQGNNKNGTGDAGDPNGNKDSYGNTPGGKVGGPKVIRGNRTVVRYYSFTAALPKATIYAQINVLASGKGTFVKLVKPSTSFSSGYADAIVGYLRNMEFNKGPEESNVTVQFNFTVN